MKTDNIVPVTRIKEIRLTLAKMYGEKEWTQEAVAEKLGVTVKSYRDWEKGKIPPSVYNLKKLSILFCKSCDYILGLSDYTQIANKEISEATGLSNASIDFLRYLNYDGNHYEYDHFGNLNKETISFINRVLESEGGNLARDEDGDTKPRPTLFRTMEQYVRSAGSKGTISEKTMDSSTGLETMKYASGELILFEDANMPEVFDISSLRREALFSKIRGYLEYFRKEEEKKSAGI